MGDWTAAVTKFLGVGKGTVQRTSPSRQMAVPGSETSGAVLPNGLNDRRATPRFRVQFRTVVSGTGTGTVVEGMGTILDLSLGGCRVESPIAVDPHHLVELRIYIPDLDWPLMVDGAVVQWVKEHTFGLRFLRLRPAENHHLARVIATLADEEDS